MRRPDYISIVTLAFLILLGVAVLGGMVWGNMVFTRAVPGEKDFFVPWLAVRTFLEYGNSPYSEAATQRAQVIYYHRLAAEGEDPLHLWLPMPVVLFYFVPAFLSEYTLAHSFWLLLNEMALAGTAWLTLSMIGWKPARFALPVILLFPVLWAFGLFDLFAASPAPLVALALAGALHFISTGQDELAGTLLTLPFFMMGIFSLPTFFLLWWTVRQRRWRILAGLGMSLALLLLISFLLLPDWVFPFLRGLYWHAVYTPSVSWYAVLEGISPVAGPRAGWIVSGLLAILLMAEWWQTRQGEARRLLWAVSLTLVIVPLIGLPLGLTGNSALLLPTFLLSATLGERWRGTRRRGLGLIILISMGLLAWLLLPSAGQGLHLLFALVLLGGMYWMKWWILRPPRTYFETLT